MRCRILMMAALAFTGAFSGCKKDDKDPVTPNPVILNTIPEFYKEAAESDYGKTSPDYTVVAGASEGLNDPQDLDFHPSRNNELWIVNKGTENTGGTTVILFDAGAPSQSAETRMDGNAYHFMLMPTAMAFSTNGNWATSPGALSANHDGSLFTGPTLWSSDLNIFAKPSGGNGSHLDMLHQSPYCMGIAAEKDNVFWVFDGYDGNIVRYDFVDDHGPGNDDHDDGRVRRYTQAKVKKADVPSHMILDKDKKWLYVAGSAEGKIYRLDITSGQVAGSLTPRYEVLAEYSEMRDASWEVFNDGNLIRPCGMEINGNRLFVSDHVTGDIVAFDLETGKELGRLATGMKAMAGLKIGPDGKLWAINSQNNELIRIDPK